MKKLLCAGGVAFILIVLFLRMPFIRTEETILTITSATDKENCVLCGWNSDSTEHRGEDNLGIFQSIHLKYVVFRSLYMTFLGSGRQAPLIFSPVGLTLQKRLPGQE